MLDNIDKKIKALRIEKRAFIGGKYVDSIDGTTIAKTSPIDGRNLPDISACNKKDVDQAVRKGLGR